MNLTRKDRWILSNQYKIMEMLAKDKEDKKTYAQYQKILTNGYESLYARISDHVYEKTFPIAQARELGDILEMFSDLKRGYDDLDSDSKSTINEHHTHFRGFDGNSTEESTYASYAKFINELDESFEDVIESMESDDYNSHMPTLETYRRMLIPWRLAKKTLIDDMRTLTMEEVKAITDEVIHPEQRKLRK